MKKKKLKNGKKTTGSIGSKKPSAKSKASPSSKARRGNKSSVVASESKSKSLVETKVKGVKRKGSSKRVSKGSGAVQIENEAPQRNRKIALREFGIEISGTRLEYVVVHISDRDKTRLKTVGIEVESLEPYSIAEAFGTDADSAWVSSTVTAHADNKKVRIKRADKVEYVADYRRPNEDLIFAWIETDEYATASVSAERASDIVLRLSSVSRLIVPNWKYDLCEDVAVVSPIESDIEYSGGSGGNYELMYIQKGGGKFDLAVDHDSDPQQLILRLR